MVIFRQKPKTSSVSNEVKQVVQTQSKTLTSVFKGFILSASVLVSVHSFAMSANETPYFKPNGWNKVSSATNIHGYQKGAEKTYIHIIDIAGGARVRSMQWRAKEPEHQTNIPGVYKYWINPVWTWKNDFIKTDPKKMAPLVVINGTFFNHGGWSGQPDPTTLSFPIVSERGIVDRGGDTQNYIGHLRVMKFDSANRGYNYPRVSNFTTYDDLISEAVKTAVVGHTPFYDKKSDSATKRTYLCAIPLGKTQGLLIYSAKAKTIKQANDDLQEWKCAESNRVMLDGSDSVHLEAPNVPRIYNDRRTPHELGFFTN